MYICVTETILSSKKTKLLTISVFFTGDPKFRCTNTSAIVNNTQHNITCEVYDVEGISCNKILWKRGDTGEDYEPGSYNNIIVTCRVRETMAIKISNNQTIFFSFTF